MRLLFLAPYTLASGNLTTATRLEAMFQQLGHQCALLDSNRTAPAEVADRLSGVDGCIVLHAWRSGRHLLAEDGGLLTSNFLKLILIFGGTDVNEMSRDPQRLAEMSRVVYAASLCICFGSSLRRAAQRLWPEAPYVVIPQSVRLPVTAAPAHSPATLLPGLPPDAHLFLLPLALRRVKDPLFLALAMAEWHRKDPSVYLVLVGPPVEEDIACKVQEAVAMHKGLLHLPAMPAAHLHALMRRAAAVVNTSISEGQPQAVMEGMLLGTPVMVRDIPGNLDVVPSGSNVGLAFHTPDQFVALGQALLGDAELRSSLTVNGRRHAQRWFAPALEEAAYSQALHGVFSEEEALGGGAAGHG